MSINAGRETSREPGTIIDRLCSLMFMSNLPYFDKSSVIHSDRVTKGLILVNNQTNSHKCHIIQHLFVSITNISVTHVRTFWQ